MPFNWLLPLPLCSPQPPWPRLGLMSGQRSRLHLEHPREREMRLSGQCRQSTKFMEMDRSPTSNSTRSQPKDQILRSTTRTRHQPQSLTSAFGNTIMRSFLLSMKLAIGSTTWRLARQMLAENHSRTLYPVRHLTRNSGRPLALMARNLKGFAKQRRRQKHIDSLPPISN